MNRRIIITGISSLVILLLGVGYLFSGTGKLTVPISNPSCAKDAQRFCSKVPQKEGVIKVCLNHKRKRVSTACRKWLDKDTDLFVSLAIDCSPDIERYCAAVPAGDGRIESCLNRNLGSLSKNCVNSMRNFQNYGR